MSLAVDPDGAFEVAKGSRKPSDKSRSALGMYQSALGPVASRNMKGRVQASHSPAGRGKAKT